YATTDSLSWLWSIGTSGVLAWALWASNNNTSRSFASMAIRYAGKHTAAPSYSPAAMTAKTPNPETRSPLSAWTGNWASAFTVTEVNGSTILKSFDVASQKRF